MTHSIEEIMSTKFWSEMTISEATALYESEIPFDPDYDFWEDAGHYIDIIPEIRNAG